MLNCSVKIMTVDGSCSFFDFQTIFYPPLVAVIAQLTSQGLAHLFECGILGTDPRAFNKIIKVKDFHRFQCLHGIELCVTVLAV